MATKRKFDAVTPRPKYGTDIDGTWWHRVGNASENDKGQISIYLDSVPVPDPKRENKIVIMLFEKKDDDQRDRDSSRDRGCSRTAKSSKTTKQDMEDEIPF